MNRLGKMLKMIRLQNDATIREQAEQMGISASTLSRLELGKPMDMETMLALYKWLTEELPTPPAAKIDNGLLPADVP